MHAKKYRSKLVLLLVCFAVHCPLTFSQPVVLQIKDKVTGSPVGFSQVTTGLLNGKAEDSYRSDSLGQVNLNQGLPVVITIKSLGYHVLSDTLDRQGNYTIMLSPIYSLLNQVVVTGQFRPQPIDKSIYPIKVIDNRQIQLKAANNLGDLLKTEVGFRFRSEGVLGDFIRIRGLSGEHVKILIDGMPVTGRVAERIDLGQLTLQNVDHIEVVEGPMSVVYGSNALAGTINIITADAENQRFQASVSTYYESIGTYNISSLITKRLRNHTFGINATRNFFSGWGPVDSSRHKTWKPKLQYLGGASYSFHRNQLSLKFNTDVLHEELRDLDSLSMINRYERALDGYHYTTRWNNRFNLTNTIYDKFDLNFQAGYSYYQKRKITYRNDLVNLHKTVSENGDLHDTTVFQMFTARGFVSNVSGKMLDYQAGIDLNYESAQGKRTGGYREVTDVAGFLNFIVHPFSNLSFQPGVRMMYNSNYNAPLVYGLNLKFNPDFFTLKASYARGFRAPSLKQLYLLFVDNNHEIHGNEYLKAETANSLNLSLSYNLTRDRNSWEFKINAFYNSIKNAIQLAISQQQSGWGKYFNIDNILYKTKGAEVGINYRYSPNLTASAGMITTGSIRLDDPDRFVWSTDFISSATYRFDKLNVQAAIFYKYSDDYLEFAGNYDPEGNLIDVAQQFMSGYHTLDINLVKDLFDKKLSLSAGLKNLFNVTMVNSYGSINFHGSNGNAAAAGYGRTFFIGIHYKFEKK